MCLWLFHLLENKCRLLFYYFLGFHFIWRSWAMSSLRCSSSFSIRSERKRVWVLRDSTFCIKVPIFSHAWSYYLEIVYSLVWTWNLCYPPIVQKIGLSWKKWMIGWFSFTSFMNSRIKPRIQDENMLQISFGNNPPHTSTPLKCKSIYSLRTPEKFLV